MSEKRSFTKSLFVGLWNAINFSRRLVFNIIFIAIIIAIIVGVSNSGADKARVAKNSALVLDLTGNIVIQKTWVDPAELFLSQALGQRQENPEILLRDLIEVIDNAARDKRIKALILQLNRFGGGGLDKLKDVGEALAKFKESGKPIYAIGDYYGKSQYYLASYADNVYLHPMGGLLMEGYSRYGNYYAEALEKLKINFNVFKVGTFKSAVEPYTRNDMSDEAKLANLAWLNEIWRFFKEDVSSTRGFSETTFDETFSQLIPKFEAVDGDFGQYALSNGWVDGLRTRAEFRSEMIELLGEGEKDNTFNQISYNKYLKMVKPALPIPQDIRAGNKVAVIVAKGNIVDGEQDPGTIGGESTAKLLRKARLNNNVKAVVLQVDSGGGSAFASEVIRQEILEIKKAGKPVVASMSSVAASGGYWISASADKIYAEPTTITGSIGIFGLLPTFEDSLEYLGIHSDGVSTSELDGIAVDRAMSDGYKSILQMSIERGYERFIGLVARERKMTLEQVDQIAQGRVWVGTQALEIGLVDELGGLPEAVEAAAELAQLESFEKIYIERELSEDELMWANLLQNASVMLEGLNLKTDPSFVNQVVEKIDAQAGWLTQLNDPMHTYVICMECNMVK